uniref:Uncharacterized protein n=1 Tax=Arundo donax TaxID=35708 RepID=A0A0A9ER91_ARUDO
MGLLSLVNSHPDNLRFRTFLPKYYCKTCYYRMTSFAT